MLYQVLATFILIAFIGSNTDNQCTEYKTYENFQIISLIPTGRYQLEVLRTFNSEGIEILKRPYGVNDSLDILVPPHQSSFIKSFADGANIKLKQITGNLQSLIEQEFKIPFSRRTRVKREDYDVYKYNSYSDMLAYIEDLSQLYPKKILVKKIGRSYEGRPLKACFISRDFTNKKPVTFIDAGIHAREWVSSAMAMYLIEELLDAGNKMTNHVDWIILPLVNPDGYEFSRSKPYHRLWRKTRSKTKISGCRGVDGNRNYDFHWGEDLDELNTCHEDFPGYNPFTERETRAVRSILMNNSNIKLYVSLHSYGQYLVYPWGYTQKKLPHNWKSLHRLAKKVSKAVEEAGGIRFNVMSAGQWYPASGGSDDYAFGVIKVPFAYTMELTDGYSFIYPESLLNVTLPQYLEGFRVFAHQIGEKYSTRTN